MSDIWGVSQLKTKSQFYALLDGREIIFIVVLLYDAKEIISQKYLLLNNISGRSHLKASGRPERVSSKIDIGSVRNSRIHL
jgi:hypothetical protein